MKISIEFVGVSRILTGEKQTEFNLPKGISYKEVVRELCRKYPVFVGQLVQDDREKFFGSTMFNSNGKKMIRADEMDEKVEDGERLILMSILAGG